MKHIKHNYSLKSMKNGMMKDLSVLQESPFTDQGSIIELFDNENSIYGFTCYFR